LYKKVRPLRTFKHYWQKLSASIKHAFEVPASTSPERHISDLDAAVISNANHTLAANLKRTHQETERARDRDKQKYNALMQRLGAVETGRDQAHELALQLEATLATVSTRLAATELQVKSLHMQAQEQAAEFKVSLLDNTNALQAAVSRVENLEAEHRHHESMLLEVQAQLLKQDRRLVSAIWVAAFASMLLVVTGAVLIWDVQKNATVLNSMSADLGHLMSAMEQKSTLPQQRLQAMDQPAVEPVTVTETTPAAVEDTPLQEDATEMSRDPLEDGGLSGSSGDYDAAADREIGRQTLPRNKRAFFIEGTSSEEQIALPGGVHYQVVQPGRGRSPVLADRVTVNYLGIGRDGRVFDDTYSSGQPAELYINDLDPAWQETLLSMEEGAQWEVSVPPGLVLINTEPGGGMPENESATYLIELLEIIH
jgi:FKBP-type peptidyl-prolyl cis-trans isomerase